MAYAFASFLLRVSLDCMAFPVAFLLVVGGWLLSLVVVSLGSAKPKIFPAMTVGVCVCMFIFLFFYVL